MSYTSLQEITEFSEKNNIPFWETILRDDMEERGAGREQSMKQMEITWKAILQASEGYDPQIRSASGLVGTEGEKMDIYCKTETPYCGGFVSEVMTEALKMAESNACMKRIVAAPTAGSCGVLPAVLVPYFRHHPDCEPMMLQAMYVAAGIGQVIAARASIAGAEGGCQAEIGAASAMAAGAMVYLRGGTPKQICHAAALALKGLLGLVCDPVAGLVEIPCVKRNVLGAVNALTCADMTLAGIESKIPPDQVIDAMKDVGDKMDSSLRETGKGGLAGTPEGQRIASKLH